ncbi:MAG: ATP-binding protein [Pseudomonadota bacterium]|nr:ATP-binding protein [Pseudomonadota bacterium]
MSKNTRSSRIATALAAFLLVAMLATLGLAIWFARDQAIEEWRAQLDNLSLVLAEQGAQEIKSAFLVLDSIAETVAANGVQNTEELRGRMATKRHFDSMRDKIRGLPQVDVATIVAANGDVVNFTRAYPAPPINLADRDYFQAHLADPSLGIFISRPVRNKGNGDWTFYLSRRLTGPHGEFLGLALVGFSSTFLAEFYKKIHLGDDATVTLYRRDFTVLARWPYQESLMGKVNRTGATFQIVDVRKKSHDVILLNTPRFADGGHRILRMGAARTLDAYPLIVNVTVTEARFLAQWRHFSLVLSLVGGCSALAMILVFSVLIRLLKRREHDMEETRQLKLVAEAASLAKTDFLAMMSHEIRTPLTSIIGFAEILERTQPGQPGGNTGAIILRNGQHLLTIINDMLDISKIEAGRLPLEQLTFSPYELAEGVQAMMASQAVARGLHFELAVTYPLPAQLVADPTRWKQILFNLTSNAIKFTERGNVKLAVRYDPDRSRLIATVTDTGIGLAPEHLANLFQPFSQADSSVARKYGGTGLGLYLVRELAARMGGAVEVDSALGHGSTFEVAIFAPLTAPPVWLQQAPPAAPQVARTQARDPFGQHLTGHVLLAEDGRDNQTLVCAFLQGMGLTYEVVDDGAAAVQAALAGNFDLVLMDIHMPVMDGVRATEILRSAGYARPIVALTANVMQDDVQRYARAGCDSTVAKPIDVAGLVQTLERLLGSAAQGAVTSFEELEGYSDIQASFQASLAGRLEEMAACIARQNWNDVVTLAHTLKGSAGSFGFPGVTREVGLVERAARHGDSAGARRAFEILLALEELKPMQLAGETRWQP